jgi:hypothetical protein
MNSAGALHGKIAPLPGKFMSYNCHYCSTWASSTLIVIFRNVEIFIKYFLGGK